eukprot:TRINITY_DN1194_c0_g2_i3.p1 TRINITY_DN1194_c0_g2~~TRINITY_DN1194_c0_g2_i3.p1  ORF type:complete len:381 (+),score=40.66 TRINITY_DN1194_c0_g2_i3:963-2105(+)
MNQLFLDTTPPKIWYNISNSNRTVYYNVSVSDDNDPRVNVTCVTNPPNLTSGSTFPAGNTTIMCTATDSAGNTARVNITVSFPAARLDINVVVNTSANGSVVMYNPTVSYNESEIVGINCSFSTAGLRNGTVFPPGTTRITCNATDRLGNNITGSVDVKIQDITPPRLTFSREGDFPNVTAWDNVSGPLPVYCNTTIITNGNNLIMCNATDASGNTAAMLIDWTISGSVPTYSFTPLTNYTIQAGVGGTAKVNFTFPNNSTCNSTSGLNSSSSFPMGNTTFTCYNKSSNTSTNYTISVVDTQPPEITWWIQAINRVSSSLTRVFFFTRIVDNVGVVYRMCNQSSPIWINTTSNSSNTSSVYCNAGDATGNNNSKTFSITV